MTKTIKVYDKKEFEEKWPTGKFEAGPFRCSVMRRSQNYNQSLDYENTLYEDAGSWCISIEQAWISMLPSNVDEFCAMLKKAKQYAEERP